MKYMKILLGLSVLIAVAAAIFLLYRRSNMLLEQFNNINNDLISIKNFLSKGNKNSISAKNIHGRSGNIPQQLSTSHVTPNGIATKPVNNTAYPTNNKVQITKDNITMLKTSIEKIEDLISSSDESDQTETDGSVSEIVDYESDRETEDQTLLITEADVIDNTNVTSYDLADTNAVNSELEVLLDDNKELDNIDTLSLASNPQDSADLTKIAEEIETIIINQYTKRELEGFCAKQFLSKSGNKKVLIERLLKSGYKFNVVTGDTENNVSKN